MRLARFKSDRLRWAVLLAAIGMVLHFAVSCLIWGRFFVAFGAIPIRRTGVSCSKAARPCCCCSSSSCPAGWPGVAGASRSSCCWSALPWTLPGTLT